MDIIISHKSALEYWRMCANVKIDASARLRRKTPPTRCPKIEDIRKKAPSGLSYPINLMVGSQNAKWKSELVRPRVYTGPVPDRCFVSVGEGIAVSDPSFCFFQMASELPLVKLIQLGLELCGSYSLPVKDDYSPGGEAADKTMYNRPQLTNVKALKAFSDRMTGTKGYTKVSRALRYIADGSASPMEAILFMLLTLPYKLGGFGLPPPELNRRIDIGTSAEPGSGKAYYVCDFFWPKGNVAVEYDSDYYHTGADRIAADSKKRLDLEAHGIKVLAMTGKQLRNPNDCKNLARVIAGRLGRRLQYNKSQFSITQHELRDLLL